MINFVTTQSHGYTVKNVVARHGRRRCRQWDYEHLFRTRSSPSGTWIFTDHDRLSDYELGLAGQIAAQLELGGARVLNHPARVRNRIDTLHLLKEAGINGYSAYRCENNPSPSSFPVFIRNAFDHHPENVFLIDSQGALDAELRRLENCGFPLTGKLVIEFSGEEVVPSVWRRFSSYRVADAIIAHHMAFDSFWLVKDGFDNDALERHPEKDRFIALEREFVSENLYADVVARAFDLARIDYGRADFSIVDGRLQIYEINTNPFHGSPTRNAYQQTHPDRRATQQQSEDKLQSAIIGLETPSRSRIDLRRTRLRRGRQYWKGVRAPWR